MSKYEEMSKLLRESDVKILERCQNVGEVSKLCRDVTFLKRCQDFEEMSTFLRCQHFLRYVKIKKICQNSQGRKRHGMSPLTVDIQGRFDRRLVIEHSLVNKVNCTKEWVAVIN